MPLCIGNEPNYSGGTFSTKSEGGSIEISSGGQQVDLTSDWSYKDVNTTLSKCAKEVSDCFKQIGRKLDVDWRLIAAIAFQESTFNPKAVNGSHVGLFQFSDTTWKENSTGTNYTLTDRVEPKAQVVVFTNFWNKNIKPFKNLSSRNDQIALCIQAHHDGSVKKADGSQWNGGDKWSDRKIGAGESKTYVPTILKHYKRFCS